MLGETGKWFSKQYSTTPAATCTAMETSTGRDYRSVWYSRKYYRTNLFWNFGTVKLRDLYVFDERYQEHYLTQRCSITACKFRNLPVMDAALYSNSETAAGIYFADHGRVIRFDTMDYS